MAAHRSSFRLRGCFKLWVLPWCWISLGTRKVFKMHLTHPLPDWLLETGDSQVMAGRWPGDGQVSPGVGCVGSGVVELSAGRGAVHSHGAWIGVFQAGVGPGLAPGVMRACLLCSLSLQSERHWPETLGWPCSAFHPCCSQLALLAAPRPRMGYRGCGGSPWPTTRVDGDGSVSLTEMLLAPGSLGTVQAAPA